MNRPIERLCYLRKDNNRGSTMICEKCGKEFFEDWRKDKEAIKTSCRFCSRSCANSKVHTEETKNKIKEKINKLKNEGKLFIPTPKNSGIRINKKCPVCNKEFNVCVSGKNKIYCSKHCMIEDHEHKFRKVSPGGNREGAGRSISGRYKGFYCGSVWELCFYIYHIDKGIKIDRCNESFFYNDDKGRERRYFPDFLVEDKIVEIKGPQDKLWEYKLKSFPKKEKLIVLYKDDMKVYIDYVKEKYNCFYPQELYDDFKLSFKYICENCGSEFSSNKKNRTFCSRRCAGLFNSKEYRQSK